MIFWWLSISKILDAINAQYRNYFPDADLNNFNVLDPMNMPLPNDAAESRTYVKIMEPEFLKSKDNTCQSIIRINKTKLGYVILENQSDLWIFDRKSSNFFVLNSKGNFIKTID